MSGTRHAYSKVWFDGTAEDYHRVLPKQLTAIAAFIEQLGVIPSGTVTAGPFSLSVEHDREAAQWVSIVEGDISTREDSE